MVVPANFFTTQIENICGQPKKKGWKSQREQHDVMSGAKVHGMQENTD